MSSCKRAEKSGLMADGGAAKFRPAAVVARLETSGANKLRKPCAAEEAVLSLAPLLGALDPRNMPGPFIADGAGAGGAELSDLGADPTSCRGQISVLSPSGMGAWEYRTGQ